jgi:hypothetical protein
LQGLTGFYSGKAEKLSAAKKELDNIAFSIREKETAH